MDRKGLEGTWTLIREKDDSARPIAVPGDIASALFASGEIPDPYKGMNELELQWIGREDWRIEREFELSAGDLSSGSIRLEAGVLDTVAEVRVNGSLLGTARNMFRRFRVEAKPLLKVGTNRVSVTIRSPERAAAEAAATLPYPIPASEYPVFSPHRNLIRKAQCMAGWDWGPCLMTGGIYDDIGLVLHDGPAIVAVRTRTTREAKGWALEITVELEAAAAGKCRLEARLGQGVRPQSLLEVEVPAGSSTHRLVLYPAGVEDWNPAGYGKQPLYDLSVRVVGSGPAALGGHEIVKRIGFREVEVVSKDDEWGKSLYFKVNGRAIFAKGANWIPADALPSRWTRERLAGLLRSAVDANMNMLRVWGGGRFESGDFYELCDELGILLWQDCMFSCALYPSSRDFLSEIEAEITDVVNRVGHHPSIALWCGNNELLGAINWYPESRANQPRYIVDYDRLTEGTLAPLFRKLDPGRTFWPSSPSAGPDDYADNWHVDGRGDMHFWSVWHEGKPFSAYLGVRPRFCSEFGYQSLPSERLVASFAGPGDRNVTSPVFEHHQRHPRGNTIIVENMLRYFRMAAGFSQTLYLSQVQQALAIRTAVEFWRSLRPRCMGTLYWQLNDVWPVASWSSLDYDGGWKILHHEARRFFEPVHLALIATDGEIEAHAMSDLPTSFETALELSARSFADGSVLASFSAAGRLDPDSSVLLWKKAVEELGVRPEEAYLDARLELRGPDGKLGLRRATAFLTEPKRCSLADAGLSASVEQGGGGLAVRVRAKAPGFWVTLDLDPEAGIAGRFEDAGFDLGAGEERLLRFLPAGEAIDVAAFSKAVRIMDLESSSREGSKRLS